jgi:hypothetical protein
MVSLKISTMTMLHIQANYQPLMVKQCQNYYHNNNTNAKTLQLPFFIIFLRPTSTL